MEIINKITFDMAAAGMPPYIDAVQGDTLTRKVEVTLMTRGQVFDPSDGFVSVSVAFKKPDGTAGWYDTLPDGNSAATVISDGVYQVSIAPEMLTVPGNVYAVFRFDLDGKTISTFPFVVRVAENPSFNSTKSENYYNVQTWDSVNASFDEIFDRLAKLEQCSGGGANIDDTNISTETTWSSQNIVDKLCPSFNEIGATVTCNPVEGYPLDVTTHIPTTGASLLKLTHTGKNLLKLSNECKSKTENGVTFTVNDDGSITIKTVESGASAATKLILCGNGTGVNAADIFSLGLRQKVDYTFSIKNKLPTGVVAYQMYYKDDGTWLTTGYIVDNQTSVGLIFNTATRFYVYLEVNAGTQIIEPVTIFPMLEEGKTATEYDPYQGLDIKTVEFGTPIYGGNYNWTTGVYKGDDGNGGVVTEHPQPTNAFSGVNYLWSSVGDTEVSGRADPNAIIKDLYNKINALSTTMTALTGV